ncbi:hypothetical protein FXO38_15923 [Capsicum annuum]|nr:hypothetical protein FXO37_31971 [Capsicum annuum]KAF3652809.1 hypothetical protein FXO38_15923 [Capsicum annuum]
MVFFFKHKNLEKPVSKEELSFKPKNHKKWVSEEERNYFLKKYDKAGNKKLNEQEFMAAYKIWFTGLGSYRAMHIVDKNNDCYISENEINELVQYAVKRGYTFT